MIHWGIIGLGTIANTFATALKLVEEANLRAVASRDIETAIAFRNKHQADISYNNYTKLANDPDVQIVYIATPHVFHYKHAKMCLERGKAVLCEKPMGMNAQQVSSLCAIAKENNTLLMEGMWTAFLPNFKRLEHIVTSKKYGNITQLHADFCFKAPTHPKHRLMNKSLGGGTILDIGIYPIFACLRLLGKPDEISVTADVNDSGIDLSCEMIFHYKKSKASLLSSFKENTNTTLKIHFDEAEVILGPNFFSPAPLYIKTSLGETLAFEKHNEGTGYELEASHFQELFINKQTESNIMSHNDSIELASYLDKVLKKAGVAYELGR